MFKHFVQRRIHLGRRNLVKNPLLLHLHHSRIVGHHQIEKVRRHRKLHLDHLAPRLAQATEMPRLLGHLFVERHQTLLVIRRTPDIETLFLKQQPFVVGPNRVVHQFAQAILQVLRNALLAQRGKKRPQDLHQALDGLLLHPGRPDHQGRLAPKGGLNGLLCWQVRFHETEGYPHRSQKKTDLSSPAG